MSSSKDHADGSKENNRNLIYRKNDYTQVKRNLNNRILMKPNVHMDSVTRKKIVSDLRKPSMTQEKQQQPKDTKPECRDDVLLSSLLSRLKTLELKVSQLQEENSSKDSKIEELLERERKTSKLLSNNESENQGLKKTIEEMYQLLKKFNIPYQCNSEMRSENRENLCHENKHEHGPQGMNNESKCGASGKEIKKRINMDYIQQKIQQLNSLIENDTEITNKLSTNIRQFGKRSEVIIVFYENGMIVDNGAFRPYEWDITKAFLRDIFDGFFPYEFKDRYPEGIFLKVVDKSDQKYTKTKAAINSHNISDVRGLEKSHFDEIVDKSTFLSGLPKHVIKNGKIIPIRSEIENLLNNKKDSPQEDLPKDITVETSVVNGEREGREVSMLKIRTFPLWKNESAVLHVEMYADESIEDLKSYINRSIQKYINCLNVLSYEIRTTFPSVCVSSNPTLTLKQLNLFPNANLLLRIN